jgi:hypothetical protein
VLYYYYRAESPGKIAAIGAFVAEEEFPEEYPTVGEVGEAPVNGQGLK